jgi:MATE family multidrug resistance protein
MYLFQTVDVIMLGHLGREALAAASLGTLIFNMLWFFALGMTTALDTLASQGASNVLEQV